MAGGRNVQAKTHRVFITLSEQLDASIEHVATILRDLGLKDVEVFSLGKVIAGEATNANLAKMRRIPEVKTIESDPTFTTL